MIIRTEHANFGRPEDLLRYMQEENIEVVTVESEYWGAKACSYENDTERCRRLGENEGGLNELHISSNNSNYLFNSIGFMS